MKKPEMVLREYAANTPDETLKFVAGRLVQRLSGDVPDAICALGEAYEVDRLLHSARTAYELYDLLDAAQDAVERELTRRHREDRRRD